MRHDLQSLSTPGTAVGCGRPLKPKNGGSTMSTYQVPATGNSPRSSKGTMELKGSQIGRKLDLAAARLDSELHDRNGLRYRMRDKAIAAKNRVGQKVHDGRVRAESSIQDHPMKSLAIAFGTGALIGLMMHSRHRNGDQ